MRMQVILNFKLKLFQEVLDQRKTFILGSLNIFNIVSLLSKRLESVRTCHSAFLKKLLSGEKKPLYNHEIKTVVVPKYEELSVEKIY